MDLLLPHKSTGRDRMDGPVMQDADQSVASYPYVATAD